MPRCFKFRACEIRSHFPLQQQTLSWLLYTFVDGQCIYSVSSAISVNKINYCLLFLWLCFGTHSTWLRLEKGCGFSYIMKTTPRWLEAQDGTCSVFNQKHDLFLILTKVFLLPKPTTVHDAECFLHRTNICRQQFSFLNKSIGENKCVKYTYFFLGKKNFQECVFLSSYFYLTGAVKLQQ